MTSHYDNFNLTPITLRIRQVSSRIQDNFNLTPITQTPITQKEMGTTRVPSSASNWLPSFVEDQNWEVVFD